MNESPISVDNKYKTLDSIMLTIPGLHILDNDKDCDEEPMSITSISKPANGHVTKNPDGGF